MRYNALYLSQVKAKTTGDKKMDRMTELHIQFLYEMIEIGGKLGKEAEKELDELKAEYEKRGIIIA